MMNHQDVKEQLRSIGYVTNKEAAELLGYKADSSGGIGGSLTKKLGEHVADRVDIPMGDKRKSSMWRKEQVIAYAQKMAQQSAMEAADIKVLELFPAKQKAELTIGDVIARLDRIDAKLNSLISEWGIDEP